MTLYFCNYILYDLYLLVIDWHQNESQPVQQHKKCGYVLSMKTVVVEKHAKCHHLAGIEQQNVVKETNPSKPQERE